MERMEYLTPSRSEKAATNLDLESNRTAHFKSSWQQHVNVFSSSSRPACVEELHQEAQLNLQSLLQDEYEGSYSDSRVTGQTFRCCSSDHLGPPPEQTLQQIVNKKTGFIFLPATKQVCEDGTTTVGILPQDTGHVFPKILEKQHTWNQTLILPTVEKATWHLARPNQAHIIPINVSGHAMDQHSDSGDLNLGNYSFEDSISQHCSSTPGVAPYSMPLRKAHSELDQPVSPYSDRMDHSALVCGSPSWNGQKESTFSPLCNNSFTYMMPVSPIVRQSSHPSTFSKHSSQGSFSSSSQVNSFMCQSNELAENMGNRDCADMTTVNLEQKNQALYRDILKFQENSFAALTDSGSVCSADNLYFDHRRESESYAMNYPSTSSEESTSADNVSITADFSEPRRQRSKSFSLRKPKKKPAPPARSVSLKKDNSGQQVETTVQTKDPRPRSLFIPRDKNIQQNLFQPSLSSKNVKSTSQYALANDTQTIGQDGEVHFSSHWYTNDWKSDDPYKSLSSSSTATGTTAIECVKVSDSTESLSSPSTSRATSPFQLHAEARINSPSKPPVLMSPSSGYSSQSETPTSTVPTSLIIGHSTQVCRLRPKVPQRKSSLPATSPREKGPRSRLSIELPIIPSSHIDFTGPAVSFRSKPSASRRHSDSSTSLQKISPSQPVFPMVTQLDLKSIRLRSVCKSDLDDNVDGVFEMIEEEQSKDVYSTPQRKVKPPVALKPQLARRPINFMVKSLSSSPVSSDSPPISPKERAEQYCPGQQQSRPITLRNIDHLTDGNISDIPKTANSAVSPYSPCEDDTSTAYPTRIVIQSLSEMEKRKTKIPPPVPKKPQLSMQSTNPVSVNETPENLHVTLVSGHTSSTSVSLSEDSSRQAENHIKLITLKTTEFEQDPEASPIGTPTEEVSDKVIRHTSEEDDEVFVQSSTSHTTEDLFTIIHRSKRKVLGRKETDDTFQRQSTAQSIKTSQSTSASEQKQTSPGRKGSSSRSSSRNENFMALLQRKNSKSGHGTRVSARELLKSTNPLARRVTEFSLPEPESNK
ncbi:NHS-like protein 2 isoform X2 [Erpetoichthys calabaricus]|uniref:NHS-like protein 2 isoform X2 n=1 Tax=Erpetoichthys calabaricus TaxID=27687 RepID=UPI0022344D65|nr:NHS-like protein 2 isoform X2 [Erpetoichthys calabaricus]